MQSYEEHDYSTRFDLTTWKKLLRLAGPYRKHIWAVFAIMPITAAFDATFPLLNRQAIDHFAANGTLQGMVRQAVVGVSEVPQIIRDNPEPQHIGPEHIPAAILLCYLSNANTKPSGDGNNIENSSRGIEKIPCAAH